ncbi:hypothetical protein SMB34_08220 [Thalassospira permensis NBRC 106175]|uniref:Uncharacterized protein n=2 Tax=Thalassospira permensis TaxID=680197 RepID=A0ABR4TIX6_9PROT|nr:hypothetical protein SMB34_08220 [Thalassospira permensis NBRC 106175]
MIVEPSSEMKIKEIVLEQIKARLSVLCGCEFSSLGVVDETYSTRVYIKERSIAIEFEIDWRECTVFTLIVRMKNGEFPEGYYGCDGKVVRYHLQEIVKRLGWDDSRTLPSINMTGEKEAYCVVCEENILSNFSSQSKLVDEFWGRIVREQDSIFS